jgi:hypothetical protein
LVRRETGLREPLNLMRRWRAAYFGISVGEEAREEEDTGKCPQWRVFSPFLSSYDHGHATSLLAVPPRSPHLRDKI